MLTEARTARLARYFAEWEAEAGPHSEPMMEWQNTLRTQYRVSDFVAWQRAGGLRLNPNFQRRPVWKKGAKSYLMDTIARGLPVPIIFLRDIRSDLRTFKAVRDVVDGQQRLRTILAFIDPALVEDYKPERDEFTISEVHNKRLGGRAFKALPEADRQRILDYQFSVHTFPADTDDREILQIFARMNSTGVKLNAQELRNAEFFGRFKTVAYSLAAEQLNRWRDWKIFRPDQIARMHEVELTSEFMLLIMNGVLEKKNSTIDKFYDDYNGTFADRAEVAKRLRHVFETIEANFTVEEMTRYFGTRTTFYALFTAVYGLQYGIRRPVSEVPRLGDDMPRRLTTKMVEHIKASGQRIADENVPPRVAKSMRGATTHASERRTLVGFLTGEDDNPCPALR